MHHPYHPPRLRVALVREREAPAFPAKILRSSADVIEAFAFLRERDREEFWVAALDGKNRIIATHQASVGTLTASLVHPREILKFLVLTSAAACTLIHVHPSGDPSPSVEDQAITSRLVDVTSLLGVRVLDHIIIGAERSFSFSDAGVLPTPSQFPC